MGSSPSININMGVSGQEKIAELNNIVLPNCEIEPSHRMMQLNMVCIDERCEFTHQLNPLCAQCLEDKSFHDQPNHKCISVPSILKELGNQALESERLKQQNKKNQSRQFKMNSSALGQDTSDNLTQYLEGIIKNLECIKASCRTLESNVRDTLRTYQETKNQVILNSNWNVICKQYENISSQPITSPVLRKCFSELQHYCKLDNQQVLLFDLEKTINNYLEQDTLDYAKQMIKLCKGIDVLTQNALDLSKPSDFDTYKSEALTHLKDLKEEKDTKRQYELEQSNILKETMYSQFKQTKITQDTLRSSQQKWTSQIEKQDLSMSRIEQNENTRTQQSKCSPTKLTDLIAQERVCK